MTKISQFESLVTQMIITVPQKTTPVLSRLLVSFGIQDFSIQAARRTMLGERRKASGLDPLIEELVDIVRFYTFTKENDLIVSELCEKFSFGESGRGSLVLRQVALDGIELDPVLLENQNINTSKHAKKMIQNLVGLSCIVPCGEGSAIARVMLKSGFGAPTVAYGRGVGSREKL